MRDEANFDDLCWYLIQTLPRQEDRAASNLSAWNVPVFNPTIKAERRNSFTEAITYFSKPLFPTYLFAKFRLNDHCHKIRYTRGIRDLVSFGDYPAPVDEQIIEMIQSRQSADGFVQIGDQLDVGDKVIIQEGVWKNFMGVFEARMKDSDRVMILLEAMNGQAHVILKKEHVKHANAVAQIA